MDKQDLIEWAIIEIKSALEDLIRYRTQETREILLRDVVKEIIRKSYGLTDPQADKGIDEIELREIAKLKASIKKLERQLMYSRVAEKKACSSFVRLNQHMTHDQIADIFDDWA